MKTIVILSHVTFDNSPYCSYVHEHAKALVKQGYNVVVFAVIHWFPILSHFQKYKRNFMKRIKGKKNPQTIDGVEVIYKKALSLSNFLYHSAININGILYYHSIKREFKNLYSKNEIIFIDAHTFKTEGYVAYRLKRLYPKIFTTVTLHGSSFERNTTYKNGIKLIKKIFNVVDYAICVSYKIKKKLEDLGVKNSKVIFNGINQVEVEDIDKEIYKYDIISVGALNPYKNHDISIKVVSELKKKYPSVHLNIVGVGRERVKLEELIRDLKIQGNIEFKNQISNKEVLSLMNRSYIFLLPSINEGFGIVYPEAMSAGCITIGTKNEGIDGFIINNENGFLIEPDVEKISKLIDEIYSNKYDLSIIRKNAYNSTKQMTWARNTEEYLNLYEKYNNINRTERT